jgi:polyhydroxybutyrate depolymerase
MAYVVDELSWRARLADLVRLGIVSLALTSCATKSNDGAPLTAAPPDAGAAMPTAGMTPTPTTPARDAAAADAAGMSATTGAAGASAGTSAAGTRGMNAADAGAAGAAGASPPSAGAAAPPDGGVPDAEVPLDPCPATSTLSPGNNALTLMHQTRSRRYNVYVPASIQPGTRTPLVFDFHGNGGSAAQERSSSGWQQKADREGFLVVYPDGVGGAWNVGNCCGEALSGNVDDVGFTRAIIEAVKASACIDPKRIFATGLSNGAGLTHRLACEAADVIAAIAAASADLVTDPCTPARPIAELSVRGLTDTLVAYAGGNTGSTGWYSPGAKGTLDLWKNIDGCTGAAETSMEYCETYRACKAGVEVTLCSLPNTGHILYSNSVGLDVPQVAWEMFKRQPLP